MEYYEDAFIRLLCHVLPFLATGVILAGAWLVSGVLDAVRSVCRKVKRKKG